MSSECLPLGSSTDPILNSGLSTRGFSEKEYSVQPDVMHILCVRSIYDISQDLHVYGSVFCDVGMNSLKHTFPFLCDNIKEMNGIGILYWVNKTTFY